jgi:hypothetical protein
MSEETITIKKSEYDKLVEDAKMLAALEACGVDNWEWYSVAVKSAEKMEIEV